MSEQPISRLPDADMQAAPAALLRAARRAREIARQTGTAVEDRLVQQPFVGRLEKALGWESTYAYNAGRGRGTGDSTIRLALRRQASHTAAEAILAQLLSLAPE